MKICDRGGHTQSSPGASASINELVEDRRVIKRVNELLREVGNEVIDVTPPESYAYPSELSYGINKCNLNNPDIFFSIHFNSTNGAKGSEVCIYPGSQTTSRLGNSILSNLASLGFVNRGVKTRTDLGELTNINCQSMIIEVCFVQEPDASKYNSLGVDTVARAIANGIDSRVSLNKPQVPIYTVEYVVVYDENSAVDQEIAETMHYILKSRSKDTHLLTCNEYYSNEYGDFRGDNIVLVGGKACNRFRYGTKLCGNDRYETADMMYKYLKEKGL